VSDELPSSVPVADTGLEPVDQVSDPTSGEANPRDSVSILHEIMSSSFLLTVLAVLIAFIAGGILIAATDPTVQTDSGYFFGRPTDTLGAIWRAVSGAYVALFRGGIYDFTAAGPSGGLISIFNSLGFATPLIVAGLGIAVGFRSGVFNIGGTGQVLAGAAAAGWAGYAFTLPFPLHMIVAIVIGVVAGAIWGGLVGLLKALTGAHEVIVTIMLNYVAYYLLEFLLINPILRKPGGQDPLSPAEKPSATYFSLIGPNYALNFGFILTIAATVFCWWLLSRSSLGFKFRAVGENRRAARVAGIRINRMYIYVMVISGSLVGLAGVYQVLGQTTSGFTTSIDANIGFSAITVALLGRSKPWGVFAAGIVFGILQAGSYTMQADQGVNVNIVPVIQSIIVLFLAAPPLVRAIFRLPSPGLRVRTRAKKTAALTEAEVTK
jgi:general nucleoside transport system permease protein